MQIYVKGGNFADFEGVVVGSEGGKVVAELDVFGRQTRVQLNPADITPSGGGDAGGSGDAGGGSSAA